MPPQPSSFGRELRRHRVVAGLSQEALAERSEVSVRTIRSIEGGRVSGARPATLRSILDALLLDEAARRSMVELLDASATTQLDPTAADQTPRTVLRRLRAERGLTQRSLARQADVSAATIGALERGVTAVALPETARRIGVAAGLDGSKLAAFVAAMTQHSAPSGPAGRLIGRAADLGRVAAAFADDRVVSIIGPGGIGKTALALALAEATDGAVRFVALADWAPRVDLRDAVAGAVGSDDLTTAASELSGFDLVVLDNVEHLDQLEGDLDELVGLLELSGRTRVLVTSRLPVGRGAALRLEPLPPDEAAELLVHRVDRLDRSGRSSWGTDDQHRQITEAVGRNPLAIGLVASWSALLSSAEVLERLAEPLALLRESSVSSGSLVDRHRDIRAVVRRTLDLLSEKAEALATELAIHPSAFTYELAERMHGDLGDVAGSLRQLVDAGIVVRHDDLEPHRFALPVVIREVVAESVLDDPRRTVLLDRLTAAMLELSDASDAALLGPEHERWERRLDADRAHHELARRHAVADGSLDAARLAGGIWRHWQLRGQYTVGAREIRSALSVADDDRMTGGAFARYGLAVLGYLRGDIVEAFADARRAHDGFERVSDEHGVLCARSLLGMIEQHRGHVAEAEGWYRSGLDAVGSSASDRDHATLLANYASLLGQEGRFAEAIDMGEEAAALNETIGDDRGAAVALGNLALLALASGRLDRAQALGAEVHATFSRLGDPHGLVESELLLAEIAVHLGEPDEAAGSLGRTERLLADLDDPWAGAVMQTLWAMFELLRGNPERSIRRSRRAIRLGASVDYGYALVRAHVAEAVARLVLGDHRSALSAAASGCDRARSGAPLLSAVAAVVVAAASPELDEASRPIAERLIDVAVSVVDGTPGPRPRLLDVAIHHTAPDRTSVPGRAEVRDADATPSVGELRALALELVASVEQLAGHTSGGGGPA